ncbi:hypothetical protein RIF29_45420 [Crotalaria pallida]|uniref:Cytochrome c assembly protein domain-containing protein n=1 Tax=Crotalaria pallida TaxID=3830 RepID=A0AAN9DTF9_CROPI
MSIIYEFFHLSLFPGLFVAFTYNKKQPPAFGAAPAFWCILLSFLGLSFRHIPNNLSNYNVLTANAPFFYQISGTWSNHEGSILSWCRIPRFYGFLLFYRGRPQSHNVSKRGGHREVVFYYFVSNFVNNSILSLPRYEQKSGAAPQLYTPFVLRTLVDSELRSRRNRTFDGPALFDAPLYPERKIRFAPLGARRSRGSREGKRRTHPLLHLARDDKERASSIDEQRIDGALGIALFFSPFLSASSDPFVRNFFVRTEPLAESNPVPQDPISAIHPPCIYAGDVASAMGFGLCRSKMMNGIVALHSPPMRKDAAEKKGTLLRSAGCVVSRITSELFTKKFKDVVATCYPALLLRSNRSLLMQLWRRFFAFSSLWTGALVDTGREQAKRVVRNEQKETTTSPLCWSAGANTVVSDQDQKKIRIWILTCRWFLTVGIMPGSWWAHHELGRGGWWFRDPVENASFMPWVLATARIHSVILPLLHSWISFLNIVTLPCCVSGTFSIRSGLLASVHSFATDDTRGIFLWRFFLLMTGISMILFSQMKLQASVRRTYQKEMVVARSTLVHLRHSARAQPRPSQQLAAGFRPATRRRSLRGSLWLNVEQSAPTAFDHRSSTHASTPKHRVACLSSRDWTSQPQRALPSNGTHSSSWMKTIESWNMMNYHQSRRGRLRGRWEPWYYDLYNYLKDGFISEYATRGQRRAWRGTRPSLLNRKKERTLLNKLIQNGGSIVYPQGLSLRPRIKKAYLRRHDCCDQELLNIIENRRSEDLVEEKVKSEPTLGSDHSRSEVLGCKGDEGRPRESRLEARRSGNDALAYVYKILMNTLYGRFVYASS